MKLGIIGSGMIVNDLLSFIESIENIELVAILGREKSREKIEKIVNQHHIKKAYYDYNELLNDSQIDTVYVAVTNELHYEFCKKAILAGKHVICEKPFTVCVDEVKELYDLAKQHQVILLEAITSQYCPNYLKIKEEVKKLGNIHIVSCNYSQYSSRYDAFKRGEILPAFDADKAGGALMDLNVYNIYFTVGLFGMPKHVQYFANIERRVDTSGILVLEYENFKAVCIGAKDCEAPITSTIQGDLGCIKIEGPTSTLADVSLIKNKEKYVIDSLDKHRMYSEFKCFSEYIDNNDYEVCDKMLKHSRIVMDVLTKARKSANIVFGCEK